MCVFNGITKSISFHKAVLRIWGGRRRRAIIIRAEIWASPSASCRLRVSSVSLVLLIIDCDLLSETNQAIGLHRCHQLAGGLMPRYYWFCPLVFCDAVSISLSSVLLIVNILSVSVFYETHRTVFSFYSAHFCELLLCAISYQWNFEELIAYTLRVTAKSETRGSVWYFEERNLAHNFSPLWD